MITTRKLLPEVYYNESRDFQLIGRIFEIAFNEVKTGIDLLANNPFNKNMDSKLVDLLAKTVGFETKHKYTVSDLIIICSCFKEIMRKKGSKEAIEILVRALLKSQNIAKNFSVDVEEFTVSIKIPYELTDKILIEDVLDYILPAGCNYRIIRANVVDLTSESLEIRHESSTTVEEIDLIAPNSSGAAEIGADIEVAVIKD